MKLKKIKLFALMMAICMVIGSIPAYALNPFGTVTLTFTSNENVDLGGIVVSVYEAVPDTYADDYVIYSETLSFTVETNEDGVATFIRPSRYCSVSVDLKTLPSGFGISSTTQFLSSDQSEKNFVLATIDQVDTFLNGYHISSKFYSESDLQLYADYEIIRSDNYSTMPWQTLDKINTLYATGNLVNGNSVIPFSIPIDVSKDNIISKYESLYYYKFISENEKFLGQCQALLAPENSNLLTLNTKSMIAAYRMKLFNQEQKNAPLSYDTELHQYDSVVINESILLIDRVLQSGNDVATLPTSTVYAEASNTAAHVYTTISGISQEIVNEVAAEMLNIYDYFVVENSFRAPRNILTLQTSPVEVEISDTTSMGDVYGDTTIVNNIPKIRLNANSTKLLTHDYWKTTLAHEYQHAIQFAYFSFTSGSNICTFGGCISESFANFASAMYAMYELDDYATRTDEYKLGIQDYFNSTTTAMHQSISGSNRQYSMLFPLYLYRHIGNDSWGIIKAVYSAEYEGLYAPLIDPYEVIDNAIKGWDDTIGIQTVFEVFAQKNLFPSVTYGMWADPTWGTPQNTLSYSMDSGNGGTAYSVLLGELGADYYQIEASDTELNVTFDIVSGNYNNLTIWTVIHNGLTPYSGNSIVTNPMMYSATSNRFTIVYTHGISSYPYFSIVAVNRSMINNDSLTYHTTISY